MKDQEPRRELHLFFASENSSAVILFRTRNSLYRLIGWDTETDKFDPGQWIKSRIFEDECALSPDGKHFLYSGMQKNSSDVFAAISTPPYFTAVAFFSESVKHDLCGFFVDNATVAFRNTNFGSDGETLACGLNIDHSRDYWRHLRTPSEWEKTQNDEIERIKLMSDRRIGQPADMIDRYRCDGAKLYRKMASGDQLLKDFSDMEFEAIKAPYQGVPPDNQT